MISAYQVLTLLNAELFNVLKGIIELILFDEFVREYLKENIRLH